MQDTENMQLNITYNNLPSSNFIIHLNQNDFTQEINDAFEKSKESFLEVKSINSTDIYIKFSKEDSPATQEKARLTAHSCFLKKEKHQKTSVLCKDPTKLNKAFIEGVLLSSYTFNKYKTDSTESFHFEFIGLTEPELSETIKTTEAVFKVKDFINEPPNKFKSEDFKNEILEYYSNTLIKTTVLESDFLTENEYGGILSVNAASNTPPYLVISEYNPEAATNSKPIILVGKGVVYDTGGLSLKPTPNSMDIMKCDMGGAGTVAGILKAAHDNNLPLHIISILPITDNLIGPNAFAPGDVIKMANGKTVEVMDTDAEGRLILADALYHAQQYDPELVIDLATLTGSALRAIGKEATVYMGNAPLNIKSQIEKSGNDTYERLVEFPLWDEYFEQIKSPIADLKNLGGPDAGAITAGKFLEQFVDYDWLHLDIAGPSYVTSPYNYRGNGATGTGVRLVYDFLKNYSK